MVTDYDIPKKRKYTGEISDEVLKCQINLDHVPEENDNDWSNQVLVKPDANPRKYESLRKANNALLKNIRLRAAESDKYRQLENALSETACAQQSENTPPVLLVDQDRCKKKRKVHLGP